MNRSKDIGTWTETQVVKFFQRNGFPHADRLGPKGVKDRGDVRLGDGIPVVVEVKGGHAAEMASDGQIREWLGELEAEMLNTYHYTGKSQNGVLVVKRKGLGARQVAGWWAIPYYAGHTYIVRWRLEDFTEYYLRQFMED